MHLFFAIRILFVRNVDLAVRSRQSVSNIFVIRAAVAWSTVILRYSLFYGLRRDENTPVPIVVDLFRHSRHLWSYRSSSYHRPDINNNIAGYHFIRSSGAFIIFVIIVCRNIIRNCVLLLFLFIYSIVFRRSACAVANIL